MVRVWVIITMVRVRVIITMVMVWVMATMVKGQSCSKEGTSQQPFHQNNATVMTMIMWTEWNLWMMMVKMTLTQIVDRVAGLVESPRIELKSNDGKDHNREHHLEGSR